MYYCLEGSINSKNFSWPRPRDAFVPVPVVQHIAVYYIFYDEAIHVFIHDILHIFNSFYSGTRAALCVCVCLVCLVFGGAVVEHGYLCVCVCLARQHFSYLLYVYICV